MFGRSPFLLAILALSIGFSALAQEIRVIDSVKSRRPDITVSQRSDDHLALARRLMRDNNHLAASAILEGVFESQPGNAVVQNLLLTCYRQLQYYGKAEILTRRQLEQYPMDFGRRLALAELLTLQGRLEEALDAYHETISLITGRDTQRWLLLIRSLVAHNQETPALELIDSVRSVRGDASLYALERGSILEKRREYIRAAVEYLPLLSEDTTARARDGERKLLALLSFEESSADVEQVLLDEARATNSVRTLRLLTSHYLKKGRYDDAYLFALRQDSLEERKVNSLVWYLRQCEERQAHAQLVRMAEHILQQYPGNPYTEEIQFEYADGLVQIGRTAEAIAAYREIIASQPRSQKASRAFYGIGLVYYDYLNDPRQALVCFDSVVDLSRRGVTYLNALKGIPYCHLRLGRLDDAKRKFGELLKMNINDDISEEIDYNLALIKLYQKQYDSAEVALRKLMVDYPRGFYVNDALKHVLAIGEAEGLDDVLYKYSNALFFRQRLMYDSARVRLTQLSEGDNKPLADAALYMLSELEFEIDDTSAALGAIQRLLEEFPDSYYLPFGMKTRADILALEIETLEEARTLYTSLLENYPNYPFISDVRRRLRELEADRKIG